ncbi:MAG: hypothetical protein ACK4RK_21215 [Gemmataceae bacterium]
MMRMVVLGGMVLAGTLAGCESTKSRQPEHLQTPGLLKPTPAGNHSSKTVPHPHPNPGVRQVSHVQANTETAARVDALGRDIIAANPQIGIRPLFRTIGSPHPEIFHLGSTELLISEGLVQQCASDAQLAAILCHELGKMVSEKEGAVDARSRLPDREPPVDMRVGNDGGGSFGYADQTRQAELAKFQRQTGHRPNRAAPTKPMLPPDPQVLARTYLTKTGFAATELDAVTPLLKAAAAHQTFEKQMTGSPAKLPWTP